MQITRCVPLPGPGIIARYGALVAVTDGREPGDDPLLSVLAEVAAADGDGSELVRRAARAALGRPGQPAWACAGVTADGGLAVLVHGPAVARVSPAGGPEVTLTASDSVIPVSRTFAGTSITLDLTAGQAGPPDPRCWLGSGVLPGIGLAVTVTVASGSGDQAVLAEVGPAPGRAAAEVTQLPVTVVATTADGTPAGWHPPTMATPSAGLPAEETAPSPEQDGTENDGPPPPPVLVDGVQCHREHLNDPGARACRQCGAGLEQPRHVRRGERPPLGVLVMDDGARITLNRDYVLGREPALDGDVMAGRAKPLRISDPEGTVSRLHLRISLVGWQVEVTDLGSANGSVLQSPGGERTLAPFEPTVVEPGAWIGVGHRSMQYLAYQGVLP
jgi:hypothetical protein